MWIKLTFNPVNENLFIVPLFARFQFQLIDLSVLNMFMKEKLLAAL